MNILSIDFDYFQRVTKSQLKLYPDGIDLDTKTSISEWEYCYAKDSLDRNELSAVRINNSELRMLRKILFKQDTSIPVMIANSHKHIYNFVCSNVADNRPLDIVNVDMHHDMINHNDELDCGNWVTYLGNKRKAAGEKMGFKWIANPISLDVYGFTNEEIQNEMKNIVKNSLSAIKDEQFDAIFFCRSDMWTPPHLDKHFTKLCDAMMSYFNNVAMESNIDEPRFDFKHISNTEALRTLKKAIAAEKFDTYLKTIETAL